MGISFTSELFLYFATIIYITTGVSAAFIKGFHVCLPYKGKASTYYPNRHRWIMIYASTILLLGCAICPENPENWISARCYNMLIPPNLLICGVRKHCDQFHKETIWYKVTDYLPTSIQLILCILGWLHLGILTEYESIVLGITYAIGIAYSVGIALTLWWLQKKIKYYYENKFSNEEEFPSNFAVALGRLSMVSLALLWCSFISTNHILTGSILILLGMMYIGVLIYTLDSHIEMKTSVEITVEEPEEEITLDEATKKSYEKIMDDVDKHMTKEKSFINTRLTINDLAHEANLNLNLLRQACKYKYGSFIKMVNTYRMGYAKELHKGHPEFSKQAIAEESGFGSYRSLLRAEKQMEEEIEGN